jgi:hypothetical protein
MGPKTVVAMVLYGARMVTFFIASPWTVKNGDIAHYIVDYATFLHYCKSYNQLNYSAARDEGFIPLGVKRTR